MAIEKAIRSNELCAPPFFWMNTPFNKPKENNPEIGKIKKGSLVVCAHHKCDAFAVITGTVT